MWEKILFWYFKEKNYMYMYIEYILKYIFYFKFMIVVVGGVMFFSGIVIEKLYMV